MKHFFSFLVLATAANGCSGSNCDPSKTSPPEGSASDFTTLPGTYQGFRLDAPVSCTSERTLVPLTGLGSEMYWDPSMPCRDPAALDAGVPDACGPTLNGLLSDVAAQLGQNGVSAARFSGVGNGRKCDDPAVVPPTAYLHIERWQDADAAVARLGAGLSARSLGESATIIVEPAIIYCPL